MEFISNDITNGQKVLTTIEDQLNNCEEFCISVAFITQSGVTPLLQTLKELEQKNIPGKILTSNYLAFSEPKAIEKLNSFPNIDLRVFRTEINNVGFHTKGYIFKKEDEYTFLVGSSNLTLSAITKNREWNTKKTVHSDEKFSTDIMTEFNTLWSDSVLASDYIDEYSAIYNSYKSVKREVSLFTDNTEGITLTPNSMQKSFIENLRNLYDKNQKRALLISATGTGKTFAAAFAVKDSVERYKIKRVLFLVHREQIAKQAINSFKKVFGKSKTMGLLSGSHKEYDADFIFSTIQSMSREEILTKYSRDEFDYIIIDEAHRSGANSYHKIMDYFNPKMFLGMTASPERTDSFDVFKLFDNNIAYEIRLQQALEEDMLCPFHYFGISDILVDGKFVNDKADFSLLTSDERVKHIVKNINYYGYSGDRVKGLIFCSRNEEAKILSEKLNMEGFRTMALSGGSSQFEREKAVERLSSDSYDMLDYIITVDIFNEGVDIPEINQVILLRPTQSPIIFVQQLGRGLRKNRDKEFVTIIDFIGNYENNFLIPIALSGDRSFNKDNIRRYLAEGNRMIKGSSTVHFDEISRRKIYDSIDSAMFSNIKLIKQCYQDLKSRLGRIPDMMDFVSFGELDMQRIHENKNLGSYHNFLKRYEPEYKVKLSSKQEKYIEFISSKLANAKRIHEIVLLELLLSEKVDVINKWAKKMIELGYLNCVSKQCIDNLVNIMTNNFITGSSKDTYKECIFISTAECDKYNISSVFESMLNVNEFRKIYEELITYMYNRYNSRYSSTYEDTSFVLYEKYTYEDVCRLLNWDKSEVALNIGGYKYDDKTKTYPVFINYDKHDDISDTINYEDRFLSENQLIAISKSGRNRFSSDVQTALKARENNVQLQLYVRKNKEDKTSKEFYYLGKIYATGEVEEFTMKNTSKSAVEISYKLQTPIREDIYDYITNK